VESELELLSWSRERGGPYCWLMARVMLCFCYDIFLLVLLGYLQPSFSISFFISFIYRILYKILSSISYFSPTTFSKSRSLYINPYIRNVFFPNFCTYIFIIPQML
jgi:hypothetical protein